MEMKIRGLDCETYSPVNLLVHGAVRYVNHPEFRVLLAAVSQDAPDIASNAVETKVIDFTQGYEEAKEILESMLAGSYITAHNAMFEHLVLERLGIIIPNSRFIDSAVVSRVAGLGSKLEAAAPQGLGIDKLPSGKEGIQLFCIPGTYQMENGDDAFDPKVIEDHPEQWLQFKEYCALDASLSLSLVSELSMACDEHEMVYSTLTMEMNCAGWNVDLPLVEEMNRRYLANVDEEIAQFRALTGAHTLNLNSHPQLMAWCKERGVTAKSFDETNVAKMLDRIGRKIDTLTDADKIAKLREVQHLLRTKQTMGGSSLKKLQTIIDTAYTCEHGKTTLYDQYLHAGASTTLRTTGKGVQMQNLRRMGDSPDDVTELFDPNVHWSNDKLSHNLRQVFTASQEAGFLIIGDYRAVESRGLAWYAGEDWKLDTYRQGLGVYEMQASKFFDVAYDDVVKEQRLFGKVGELSCGYQAGAEAVQGFAEKMGVPLTHGEATKLVSDFRNANPKTVQFWLDLQRALEEAYEVGMSHVRIPEGSIDFYTGDTVPSLQKQTKDDRLKTLIIKVSVPCKDDVFEFRRIFHGLYREGRSFNYWKPSARKTGDLWVPDFVDPKTKRKKKYSVYGGKLAGVLTQSLCREIFMNGLTTAYLWTMGSTNVELVGQFHDEMVADWTPGSHVLDPDLDASVAMIEKIMSTTELPNFPLEADVKYAYRYTK